MTATSGASPFEPGYVFAARYRLVDRLDADHELLWRADDLVLQTPVALQFTSTDSPDVRERTLEHVRLVRQITHPAIRRVFDVGEADGLLYCSQELIDGEDLGRLLRRAGRLPSERVAEIGRQLCAGLAAIHAQGVQHGDLGLSNVLLDELGRVRIIDPAFTPFRTENPDLVATGALLYELLAGRPPRTAPGVSSHFPLPKPSSFVADVNPRLERVILQALADDPVRRPASAAAMAARLAAVSSARPWGTRRRWLMAAALVLVTGAVAVWGPRLLPTGPRVLTEQDTIVLAAFVNTTGDSVFDGTLEVALAVALEQSPFLRIFPDDRARETLRLMERAPDERLTPALAREVARRERLKALVAGSIATRGNHYVLALEVINAARGDVVAREQVEASGKEEVLTTLGAATARLREKLGESLASIERFDAPLPRATTASLEALHAYALALDQGRVLPRVEAIPHLKRALEIDPQFAMAQALLSGVYANTGRFAEAPEFSRQAFALRDRVSERERFFISWRYYVDAAQAWDKALELSQSWTRTYPREAFAFNSLGIASAAFGDHAQAARAFQEAMRLDPQFVPPHGNLAGSLIASDRFAEAKRFVAEAGQRGIAFISVQRMAFLLALVENDTAAMTRALESVRASSDAPWALVWEARASSFAGRFAKAHDLFSGAVRVAHSAGLRALAAQWTMEDAELHAVMSECRTARTEVRAGLALGRDNFTLERAARTLALCGDRQDVERLHGELASRFPAATLTARVHLPLSAAALALERGDAARALELLERVKPYDLAPAAEFWPAYLRGLAYLRTGDAARAAAEFDVIVRHRGAAPTSPLYPLAMLGAARAARLSGDAARARASYDALFARWSGADASLAPLVHARAERARLR